MSEVIDTDFNFRFQENEQLEKMIEILMKADRGRSLIAAYLLNNEDIGEELLRIHAENSDASEYFDDDDWDDEDSEEIWEEYDDWYDAEAIEVAPGKMSGSVMCFNEWDPEILFPKVIEEVAIAYPKLPFEGEVDLITYGIIRRLNFNYSEGKLKLIITRGEFEEPDGWKDEDTIKYQTIEKEVLIEVK